MSGPGQPTRPAQSGLVALLAEQAAAMGEHAGMPTPARYTELDAEWQALDSGAAVLDLGYRRTIRAIGGERADFLQGQLSGDVAALAPGDGLAALALSAQGRVQSLLSVYAAVDEIEIGVDADLLDATLARLNQFLVADDVEFEAAAPVARIGLAGPAAAEVLARAGVSSVPATGRWLLADGEIDGNRVRVLGRGELRVPFVEVKTDGDPATLWRRLCELGAVPAGTEAYEIVRVESGTARYGVDVDDRRVAVEARLEWAIHFAKGCYVGQEIIERAVSRGRLQRELCLVAFEQAVAVGSTVTDGSDKDVVTSVAHSPRLGPIGLAYVARDLVQAGTELTVGSGERRVGARVLEWPRSRELAGR